ncbi:MAG: thiamine phosphate synthase [Candidatus Omnitrophica bacterium]|nr:thiamine phosphate synthase [Candidatus Omnitrophota bacterium]MDD5670634.1 thiamine phosphate synthase [Candidatus Omnitrophota bacterium]
MNWKKTVFLNFNLYAVTDIPGPDARILDKIEQAYRGGADIVQLRSKALSDAELYRLGLAIRPLADRYQKLFFINDRVDLALACQADGVHLGQDDMPVGAARAMAERHGAEFWIGKSTHSIEQALEAAGEGADYIGVGPVYATPTKPGRPAVGLELVKAVSQKVKIPFVAIGGIHGQNIREVLAAGASRVAVVRAIFSSEDIYESTQRLRNKIESCLATRH